MKTLFLIRHAKSSWSDPQLADYHRPLNPRGERDAPFMARLLHAKAGRVDLIVSSPAKRAITTARYFARTMGIADEAIQQYEKIYEAYPEEVLEVIGGLDDAVQSVLVFGHNPAFTSLANRFGGEYIPNVPTCGIVKIEATVDQWRAFNSESAQRTAFYYPKQYFS